MGNALGEPAKIDLKLRWITTLRMIPFEIINNNNKEPYIFLFTTLKLLLDWAVMFWNYLES